MDEVNTATVLPGTERFRLPTGAWRTFFYALGQTRHQP